MLKVTIGFNDFNKLSVLVDTKQQAAKIVEQLTGLAVVDTAWDADSNLYYHVSDKPIFVKVEDQGQVISYVHHQQKQQDREEARNAA